MVIWGMVYDCLNHITYIIFAYTGILQCIMYTYVCMHVQVCILFHTHTHTYNNYSLSFIYIVLQILVKC